MRHKTCPRDSDWCDGVICVEHGIQCPNARCPERGETTRGRCVEAARKAWARPASEGLTTERLTDAVLAKVVEDVKEMRYSGHEQGITDIGFEEAREAIVARLEEGKPDG